MVICFPQIRNIPSAYNKHVTGFGSFTAEKYGTRCPAHEYGKPYSCAGHLVPYVAAVKNPHPVTSLYDHYDVKNNYLRVCREGCEAGHQEVYTRRWDQRCNQANQIIVHIARVAQCCRAH